MGLAVLANKTARAHQHRAVKQLHTVPFRQPCGQIHLMLTGKIEPGLHARTFGNQLGMQESFLASLTGPRAATAEQLAAALGDGQGSAATFDGVSAAYRAALAASSPDDMVIVFGSFYTVADILAGVAV